MTATPTTMEAIVQPAYGLDAFEFTTRPVPTAGKGQLRIRVSASTVNPMDLHLATGTMGIVRLAEGLRRPKHPIPGREASGVIDQVGPGVTGFDVGQRVFGWVTGGFADFAVADADRMCLSPSSMSDLECAGLPIAGAAAMEAVERGNVSGKRVVINGASGGVGHYAVQIAKARGASWVAGVCSSANVEFVRSLGADQVIAYDADDFADEVWDTIIDCVGNRSDADVKQALVEDGRWIMVGDTKMEGLLGPLPRLLGRLVRWRLGSRSCVWFVQGEDARFLTELAELVDAGHVRTVMSKPLNLEDVPTGYRRIQNGRSVGKLSVHIADVPAAPDHASAGKVGSPS